MFLYKGNRQNEPSLEENPLESRPNIEDSLWERIEKEKSLRNVDEINNYLNSAAGKYHATPEDLLKFTQDFLTQFENFPSLDIEKWSLPKPDYDTHSIFEEPVTNVLTINFEGGPYSGSVVYGENALSIALKDGNTEYSLHSELGAVKDLVVETQMTFDTEENLKRYAAKQAAESLEEALPNIAIAKEIALYVQVSQSAEQLYAIHRQDKSREITSIEKEGFLANAISDIVWSNYVPSAPDSKIAGFSYQEDANGCWTISSRLEFSGEKNQEHGTYKMDTYEVLATGNEPIFGKETTLKFGISEGMLSVEKGENAHILENKFEKEQKPIQEQAQENEPLGLDENPLEY